MLFTKPGRGSPLRQIPSRKPFTCLNTEDDVRCILARIALSVTMTRLSLSFALCFIALGGCKSSKETAVGRQVISAAVDMTGRHYPGTASVSGPSRLICLEASGAGGSCFVVAPGYTGNLQPGGSRGTSGPGTVALDCSGTGDFLQCSLQIN